MFRELKTPKIKRPDKRDRVNNFLIYKRYTATLFMVCGIIRVVSIEKGDEYDIVKGYRGQGYGESFLMRVLCTTNESRKQIYCLKKNQLAMVWGITTEEKKTMSATCFFPAYVPNAYDRKHNVDIETKNSIEPIVNSSDDFYKEDTDFLSQFERN